VLAAPLVGGCMTVTVNEESRPAGCATFDRIAVTIEAEGPGADVAEPLQQIEREARSGGDTDVADAAAALLAAHSGKTGNWYSALGDMEAACRGQR